MRKLTDSCPLDTSGEETLNGFPSDGNGSVKVNRIDS